MNTNSLIRQDAQDLLSQSIENAKVQHIEYRTRIGRGFFFLTVNIEGKIFASTTQSNIADAVKDILQKVSEDKTTDKEYYTLQRSHIVDCMAWSIEERMVEWMMGYHNTKPSFSFISNVRDIRYYADINMNDPEACISIYDLNWKLFENISAHLSALIQKRESEILLRYAGKMHEQREEQKEIHALQDEHYAQMAMGYAETFSY